MNKELELWQFIAERLGEGQPVMLLVVGESSGSSPGRQGYKMAVGADGELFGSIGGGVMEVNLVQQSRKILSEPEVDASNLCDSEESPSEAQDDSFETQAGFFRAGFGTDLEDPSEAIPLPRETGFCSRLIEQVHKKNAPDASGMICSGRQTVIMGMLLPQRRNSVHVERMISALKKGQPARLKISNRHFRISPFESKYGMPKVRFQEMARSFAYTEQLGYENALYIIGGGHCALALSELMSKMDFHISIFDDRPELNTIEKNSFAHEINLIENYERTGDSVPSGENVYVVVMTLGYRSDETVIRALIDKEFKYFGVLGSKAKMGTLMNELRAEGVDEAKLASIHTPIGLPIKSRTPEEIAVSIAAEIIAVKNAD